MTRSEEAVLRQVQFDFAPRLKDMLLHAQHLNRNIDRILDLIDEGHELPFTTLHRLIRHESVRARIHKRWQYDDAFEDDATFTMTRTSLLFEHQRMDPSENYDKPALPLKLMTAQLTRMFNEGRANARYTTTMMNAIMHAGLTDFVPEYLARFKGLPGPLTDQLAMVLDAAYDLRRFVEPALGLRTRLFRKVWLPAAISATEYETVRGLSDPLLHELYGKLWHLGYEGWRLALGTTWIE